MRCGITMPLRRDRAAPCTCEQSHPSMSVAQSADEGMVLSQQVAPEVDEGLQKQLEEMGFGTNRAIRALHFTGTANLEQVLETYTCSRRSVANLRNEPLCMLIHLLKAVSSPAHWFCCIAGGKLDCGAC